MNIIELNQVIMEPVQEKDLEQIYEIEKENFRFCWSKNYILLNIKLPESFRKFYVAKVDDEVVGYVVCWLSDETAHIHNISVKKDYQNVGVGSKILNFLIEKLKKINIKTIVLEVRISNFSAINLYKKFGFKDVIIKEKFYPDGENAIVMIKEL